jgi:hypothetical protein
MIPMFPVAPMKREEIVRQAAEYLDIVQSSDRELESVFLQPRIDQY